MSRAQAVKANEGMILLPAHDVAQFLQVSRCEEPVISVTALNVFIYAMQI